MIATASIPRGRQVRARIRLKLGVHTALRLSGRTNGVGSLIFTECALPAPTWKSYKVGSAASAV